MLSVNYNRNCLIKVVLKGANPRFVRCQNQYTFKEADILFRDKQSVEDPLLYLMHYYMIAIFLASGTECYVPNKPLVVSNDSNQFQA